MLFDPAQSEDPYGGYRDARVLVLGGSGFIGYNLTSALASAGARVTAVSRGLTQKARPHPESVLDKRVDMADIDDLLPLVPEHDVIFDVAGRSGAVESNVSPLDDLRVNLVGQFNLLEACRRTGSSARIVFASSRLVYGRPQHLPVDETHSTEPTSVYGVHRLAAEKYHQLYHRIHGLAITILRITVPYGPYQALNTTSHGVVNLFMSAVAEGHPITLYGEGRQVRDVLHVDDLVRAFLTVAQSKRSVGQIFNVGGAMPVRLRDLADAIIGVAGGGEVRFAPWPEGAAAVETGDFYADIARIKNMTGWVPRITLKEGLQASFAYYRARSRQTVAT